MKRWMVVALYLLAVITIAAVTFGCAPDVPGRYLSDAVKHMEKKP